MEDLPSDEHTIEVSDKAICRNCLADVRMARCIMDPTTGREVRMFECEDCGQRSWDA